METRYWKSKAKPWGNYAAVAISGFPHGPREEPLSKQSFNCWGWKGTVASGI